ncbi:hypothetical protein PENTCL1PPCAC_8440, partial [Pristionchus entomophagus]
SRFSRKHHCPVNVSLWHFSLSQPVFGNSTSFAVLKIQPKLRANRDCSHLSSSFAVASAGKIESAVSQ